MLDAENVLGGILKAVAAASLVGVCSVAWNSSLAIERHGQSIESLERTHDMIMTEVSNDLKALRNDVGVIKTDVAVLKERIADGSRPQS